MHDTKKRMTTGLGTTRLEPQVLFFILFYILLLMISIDYLRIEYAERQQGLETTSRRVLSPGILCARYGMQNGNSEEHQDDDQGTGGTRDTDRLESLVAISLFLFLISY